MSVVSAKLFQPRRPINQTQARIPTYYIWLVVVLVFVLLSLIYRLIFGDGSLQDLSRLSRQTEQQLEKINVLEERNAALRAEVADLKKGLEAIEERARTDLGMIREGEVFYQFIEKEQPEDR